MYQYRAKITKVIDGDMVEAKIDVGFDITIKKIFRLYGCRQQLEPDASEERKMKHLASLDRLKEMVEGKVCIVDIFKDKNNYLIVINAEKASVNQLMIDHCHVQTVWEDFKIGK